MSETYDYLIKFLIIGNAGSGKSCILYNLVENKFKPMSSETIGVEFGCKLIQVDDKLVKLQIWDTAGQERFRAVTKSYYRGAAGCLLVYDTTCRDSYKDLMNWLNDAYTLATPNLSVTLCGNKADKENERQISTEEAKEFAKDQQITFMETSAKSGQNIEHIFLECTRDVLQKVEAGDIDPSSPNCGVEFGNLNTKNIIDPNVNEKKCLCR
ncbi:Ras-related protein Rab-4B [Intoshia linei]|uniref:Ras-related protein Rab-4B n=1 Tax=Intoshia linei TaxID=1819745 RepID=A0A177AU66_9BILA|nr:Ras-related protein Rab-4B [Intoshia linei]